MKTIICGLWINYSASSFRFGFLNARKVHPYTGMLETASLAIIMLALPETQKEPIVTDYYPQDCGAATEYCSRRLNWVLELAGAVCTRKRTESRKYAVYSEQINCRLT